LFAFQGVGVPVRRPGDGGIDIGMAEPGKTRKTAQDDWQDVLAVP
jgi:hypothetical protein